MKPTCHNRPPRSDGAWVRMGYRNGKQVLRWAPRWFVDRCATWDGTGITGPAATHAPYPVAMGWDCRGCRWLPEGR